MWLSHNGPRGARFGPRERYPNPSWRPARGWRVDPALAFAHALQESNFRPDAVSPAGARGLMQVRPGTAGDLIRWRGIQGDPNRLTDPVNNIEFGQTYLEYLRDMASTGGLLPKVIASYNAGPAPIAEWNFRYDQSDPLLYIEMHPLLGDARLRADHPAQLLDLRGARRRPVGHPPRAGAGPVAALPGPARPDRGPHRAAPAPSRDGAGLSAFRSCYVPSSKPRLRACDPMPAPGAAPPRTGRRRASTCRRARPTATGSTSARRWTARPPLRTTVTVEKPKTIITRNASPDIGFDRSINPYRGCEHGCIYCFARPTHAFHDLSPGLDFESRLFAKPDAAKLLRAELGKHGYQVRPIALGTNTDPYQPIEGKWRITRSILEVLAETKHPVTITTKSDRVLRDLDLHRARWRRTIWSASRSR